MNSERARSQAVLLWDAISALTADDTVLVAPDAVTHLERQGPLVVGYVIDNGVVLRTVVGLTKFSVRHKLSAVLGRPVRRADSGE